MAVVAATTLILATMVMLAASESILPAGFVPKCQHEAGWTYVADYWDDPNKDDIPDSENEIAAGFSNSNAYFIGSEEVKKLDFIEVSLCAFDSGDSCSGHCITFDSPDLNTVCDEAASQSTDGAKVALMLAGVCQSPFKLFFPVANIEQWTNIDSWSGFRTGEISRYSHLGGAVHFSGQGVTLMANNPTGSNFLTECIPGSNVEIGYHGVCQLAGRTHANNWQIRMKTAQTTTTTSGTTSSTTSISATSTTSTPMVFVDGVQGQSAITSVLVLLAVQFVL